MSLFSWFNSADQVDAALVYVAVIGAIIEAGVAVAAVINVHKELEESRKEKLEKYIEIFACVAAFFFLAEAILGCRSSVLLGKELEMLKSDNLTHERQVEELRSNNIVLEYRLMPRAITQMQMTNFIFLMAKVEKIPIKVHVGVENAETISFARNVTEMLANAGFPQDNNAPYFGISRDAAHPFEIAAAYIVPQDSEFCFFLSYDTNPAFPLTTEKTNGFLRPIVFEKNPRAIYNAIYFSLIQIGIKTRRYSNTTWVKPGEYELFIPQKSN